MNLYQLFSKYGRYNSWANQQLLNWLSVENEEIIHRKVDSSFPTIWETLTHIMSAQEFYLGILMEQERERVKWDNFQQLKEGLRNNSESFAHYLMGLDQEKIMGVREVKRGPKAGFYPLSEFVLHCFNHSTYHRGQIISMGHQLSISTAPNTDFYQFSLRVDQANEEG